jgi:hypothetical protein
MPKSTKKQTSIRFTEQDQLRIERLQKKFGINQTAILSLAISKLFDENFYAETSSDGGIIFPFCDEKLIDDILVRCKEEFNGKALDIQVLCGGQLFVNPTADDLVMMREIVRKIENERLQPKK